MGRRLLSRLAAPAILFAATAALAQPPAAAPASPPAAGGPPRSPFAALMNRGPREVTNSIGMVFVEIPQGSFVMGRYAPQCPDPNPKTPPPLGLPVDWKPADYVNCRAAAKQAFGPGFLVSLPTPFMLAKYEVTQAQFERVMGYNPSYFKAGAGEAGTDADKRPVDSVSWDEASAFVAKLNALEHTTVYRLPTEAEWEWAARAGQEPSGPWVVFNFGNDANGVMAGQGGRVSTAEVGTKKPNAWGLYDMLGNVWEWVADFYNERYLPDPTPPKSGKTHVLKGGSFLRDPNMTFAADHAGGPGSRVDVGFRILRTGD